MKVYISLDAEGISGIVKFPQVIPSGADYSFGRRMMVGDCNAAIRGAFLAGATEVVVNDAHNRGDNLLIDELDPRAKLISGADRPLAMMEGIDRGFDAALFVGYHSSKGGKGVLAHTYYYKQVMEATLNKRPVGEFELNGLLAGYYNVPVVYLSGDNEIINEAVESVPGLYSTVTKEAIGPGSALCYHPAVTQKSIEEDVQKALVHDPNDRIKPMVLDTDTIELEIQFVNTGYAAYAARLPGFERVLPTKVRFEADKYLDVYKGFRSALYMASAFSDIT